MFNTDKKGAHMTDDDGAAYTAGMVKGYAECAIWAGLDWTNTDDHGGTENNPIPLDTAGYSTDEITAEAWADIILDCRSFYLANAELLAEWDAEQAGHDFYLTRNGHGTGFWDRGKPAGDALTAACRPYGEHELMPNGDGTLGSS